ncbi:hypothetical protein NW765_005829 [Fusarium oxysporum]|nr:hypothetical protein NW765_005829 [Fusarium oxysporum]
MCSFLIRDKNAEARDKNQFKYRHTNCVFNPPDGKYIVRSDPVECLIAGQRQFWQAGPHAITHKPRATIDHSAKPTFKTVNWSGGAGGGTPVAKEISRRHGSLRI